MIKTYILRELNLERIEEKFDHLVNSFSRIAEERNRGEKWRSYIYPYLQNTCAALKVEHRNSQIELKVMSGFKHKREINFLMQLINNYGFILEKIELE